MKLIIIGNGFDLYHGLLTNYREFILFLKSNYLDVYEGLIKAIRKYSISHFSIDVAHKNYNWAELEAIIGSFDPLELVEEYRDWDSPIDYNGEPDAEIEEMLKFGMNINTYLTSWIKEINYILNAVEKKEKIDKIISATDLFLSFNYTLTLEQIYNIPDVLHIHGTLPRKLIMGHNELYNIYYSEEYGINSVNEKYIKRYFNRTEKKTSNIINKNQTFFNKNSLEKITHVYILGHSMNQIDIPYFKKILELTNSDVVWYITYYDSKDIDFFRETVTKLGIKKVKFISWDDL
ncbi:AbiH family protein [Enterococcus sp. DIV0170]|uniref:AbiH family protein n=1 Tax=Enterococcus sp. DIV0170 TaxID=2774642 RepID=UPI003F255AF8